MQNFKLTVIVPVFNEEKTIEEIINRIHAVDIPKEIIVIDDCSNDSTAQVLKKISDKVDKIIRHERNMGKGAAIRTGVQFASGNAVVIQDADLEYNPQDFHKLLKPFLDGSADVVYGSRVRAETQKRLTIHHLANRFLTFLSNLLSGLKITDMETCYKLFRTNLIKGITIEQNRFGFEPEITAKIAKIPGCRIQEVDISYSGRTYHEGKKITWRDGINAIKCIIKYSRK
ncbi:MAG: glycosyltransferase family 2 protein [bacterium]